MTWNEYTFTGTDLTTSEVIMLGRKACSQGDSPIHLARAVYAELPAGRHLIQVRSRDRIWDYPTWLHPWHDDEPGRSLGISWRR
jgi:hypothetical protein